MPSDPCRPLCFRCDPGQRGTDSTELSGYQECQRQRMDGCIFYLREGRERVLLDNTPAFCIADGGPLTEGHILVIPWRGVADGEEEHQQE